jgi:hypothetical protein
MDSCRQLPSKGMESVTIEKKQKQIENFKKDK